MSQKTTRNCDKLSLEDRTPGADPERGSTHQNRVRPLQPRRFKNDYSRFGLPLKSTRRAGAVLQLLSATKSQNTEFENPNLVLKIIFSSDLYLVKSI